MVLGRKVSLSSHILLSCAHWYKQPGPLHCHQLILTLSQSLQTGKDLIVLLWWCHLSIGLAMWLPYKWMHSREAIAQGIQAIWTCGGRNQSIRGEIVERNFREALHGGRVHLYIYSIICSMHIYSVLTIDQSVFQVLGIYQWQAKGKRK